MVEREIFSKIGPKNPNAPPTPKPPKGNPDHIRPPQKQYPPTKPHRQPERKSPKK